MKGREAKPGAPAADLLVCFPSRAHLTLMPKPICSPARPSDTNKRHHHLKKIANRGGGQASPMLWAKTKSMDTDISEPTSPKVTCAGQIKVRPKSSCKSWQSVMEEIERIHNRRKDKSKPNWAESIGFKKEVMQFLTCLRNIRLDFRCFGGFPQTGITSDNEDGDDDEDEEEEEIVEESDGNESSRTVFSKWFMVLQENQSNGLYKEEIVDINREEKQSSCVEDDDSGDSNSAPAVPPPNALLLMRCRSAPAKSWLEQQEEEEQKNQIGSETEEEDHNVTKRKSRDLKSLMEEETRNNNKENMIIAAYDTDFYKISTDIAKETWVIGGIKDPFSRSRSWKR